jgi:histidyl-tRNA synthetase
MYTFEDRSGRSLTLRRRGRRRSLARTSSTASHRSRKPVKAYRHRADVSLRRPGRGRYREHWQLSLEAIGSEDPAVDAEVISSTRSSCGDSA